MEGTAHSESYGPQGAPPPETGPQPEFSVVSDQEVSQEASFGIEGKEEVDIFSHLNFDALHPYTIDELRTLFTPDEMAEVESYQRQLDGDIDVLVEKLIQAPVPHVESAALARRLGALINNTDYYPEEVEDYIAEDPLIEKLLKKRNDNNVRGNKDLDASVARAFRARRSVLAYECESTH